ARSQTTAGVLASPALTGLLACHEGTTQGKEWGRRVQLSMARLDRISCHRLKNSFTESVRSHGRRPRLRRVAVGCTLPRLDGAPFRTSAAVPFTALETVLRPRDIGTPARHCRRTAQ